METLLSKEEVIVPMNAGGCHARSACNAGKHASNLGESFVRRVAGMTTRQNQNRSSACGAEMSAEGINRPD